MPLLDDLAAYLETLSIGTVGTDLFPGKMPEQPDICVCLYQLAGMGPDPITTLERPGVKIRIRNLDTDSGIEDAIAKGYAIKKALHRKTGLYLGTPSCLYHRIDATGNPDWIGQDKKGRSIIDVNFIVLKEEE